MPLEGEGAAEPESRRWRCLHGPGGRGGPVPRMGGVLGRKLGEEDGNVGWRMGGGLSSGGGLVLMVLTNCQFQRGCN